MPRGRPPEVPPTRYLRTGDCNDCGDCCGANGLHNFSLGWETIRTWDLSDVAESFNLWTLFGLGWNPQLEQIQPEAENGSHKAGGTDFYYTWKEIRPGKGQLPCKDTSAAHDGSSYSVECPFLLDDPGDGSRPCGLVGTDDDGARKKTCRPEEHNEYKPEEDIWTERSVQAWQARHPNCTYVFTEIT